MNVPPRSFEILTNSESVVWNRETSPTLRGNSLFTSSQLGETETKEIQEGTSIARMKCRRTKVTNRP